MAVLSSPIQFIASVPPVTRAWTTATIVSSLLYFWVVWKTHDPYVPYLTLVPGSSLFYPWTFLTSGLVEVTLFEFAFTLIFIPPSLMYLERLWGTIETIKILGVTIVVSNIIAFAFNWIEYIATRNADVFLYGMQYHGQMSVLTAVLVGFRQAIPEHQVQFLGLFQTRVKNLPMAYLTFSTVMTFLGFQCPFIIIQFAWLVSWVWLRFYKKNATHISGGDSYGDRSETFALIYWFPPFAHKPIGFLGDTVHMLATKFHLLPGVEVDVESGGYSQLPGGSRAEAERRRAMALKALDQRMAGAVAPPPQNGSASQTQSPRTPVATVHSVPIPAPSSATDGTDDEADVSETGKSKE